MKKNEKVRLLTLKKHLMVKDITMLRKQINSARKCLGKNFTIRVDVGQKIVKIYCVDNKLSYFIFQ